MKIDHLFLAFYNETSLRGMKYLFKESLARNYKSIIVVASNQYLKVKDIDEEKIIYINLFLIRMRTLLDLMKFDTLIFLKNYVFRYSADKFLIEFKKFLWKKKFDIQSRMAKRILDKYNPKIMYIYGDRTRSFEPSFLKIAKIKSINVVVAPIVLYLCNKDLLWKYRNKELRKIHNFNKKDITKLLYFKENFKGQYFYHELTKKYLSYYEPWVTEVMKEKGVLSKNPWQIGLGLSSYVCMSGENEYKKFILNKVPAQKLKITGNPETDILYNSFIKKDFKKSEFILKNNINNNKKK